MCDPTRASFVALTLCLALGLAGRPAAAAAASQPEETPQAVKPTPARIVQTPPETVTRLAEWVIAAHDNDGLPFAIVDKVAARVFVFGADGQLLGGAPALVGSARGDNSSPGVGDREISAIPLSDRTTPAGRFVGSFGSAKGSSKVLWVDYATAIALHPVDTGNPREKRLQRLGSRTPRDNHITHGCINVSAAFYEKVVRPTFTGTTGIFYILPEQKPVEEVFPALQAATRLVAADDRSDAGDPRNPGASAALGPTSAATTTAALGK
jgi:hypothetical protein